MQAKPRNRKDNKGHYHLAVKNNYPQGIIPNQPILYRIAWR
jgi:hypothetical protein